MGLERNLEFGPRSRRSMTRVGLALKGRCHEHAAKKKIRGRCAWGGMTQETGEAKKKIRN